MKVLLCQLDLDPIDRCAARRHYRILRIVTYAPQSSEHALGGMCQGWYGMDRDEAKAFIFNYYTELSWHNYLGEK